LQRIGLCLGATAGIGNGYGVYACCYVLKVFGGGTIAPTVGVGRVAAAYG